VSVYVLGFGQLRFSTLDDIRRQVGQYDSPSQRNGIILGTNRGFTVRDNPRPQEQLEKEKPYPQTPLCDDACS
jgi:hypothetical protein